LILASLAVALSSTATAQHREARPNSTNSPAGATGLGRIDFPVSGPRAAKIHFVRGMLAVHSFWYEEARDEFREATRVAPDFAMGYWGEALTYFHPVWGEENVAASRAALQRIPNGTVAPALTPREKLYIDAARTLVGDGDRATRWRRYADSMRDLHVREPKDDEAATLYAVALLGTALGDRFIEGKEPGFRRFAEAAAIGMEVLTRNPAHPGAAHYVIHALDDPEHAVLALSAAGRYAQIAPEASHAQHMPSHIFVQLGMWPEASASNEAAWTASDNWVRRKKLDVSHHDFHSLSWLQSIRLEQGKRRQAAVALGMARGDLAMAREKRPRLRLIYAQMVADYLSESDDWLRADDLLAPLAVAETDVVGAQSAPPGSSPPASSSACHARAADDASDALGEKLVLAFVRGLRALAGGDVRAAEASAEVIGKLLPTTDVTDHDLWRTRELELRGRAAGLRGDVETAIAKLKVAIELDERNPPSGPVQGVTPRERLADLLLTAGRAPQALQSYRRVLDLHPRRARALLGAARAAMSSRDPAASSYWSELAVVWSVADSDLPEVAELHRASVRETGTAR
jgi:tetratricopeptide (TPR) repeat protein